ncbi:hypothetical protein [Nocardia bovistercoris]|uniref:Uncharacterized protein n=1 Tax=Nocardia bovistercoris TaxID=2785916 RepID=A0A931I8F5_9NOCA|nr:hypothetical protein [Nocardia bovistercoris]
MIGALLAQAPALLAQTPGTPTGPEFGKASPLGLAIILLLLVGTILLVRSMNRHLKNLPPTFEPEHPEPDQEADEGTEHGITRRTDAGPGDSANGG